MSSDQAELAAVAERVPGHAPEQESPAFITIRKILRPLALRALAAEYSEDFISIWVNPPRALLQTYAAARAEFRELMRRVHELDGRDGDTIPEERQAIADGLTAVNQRFFACFAEIWSQSQDPAMHVNADQVRELADRSWADDPAAWEFLVAGTWRLIGEHYRHAVKVNGGKDA